MKVVFEHGFIFDEYIAELTGHKLDQRRIDAVEGFLPRIQKHWDQVGIRLLKTASLLSGFEFKLSESRCTIITGESVSMSHPFIVNVGKYLEVDDLTILEEVIFHELLHILLTDNWKVWPTKLIKEHSGLDPVVDAHVHLMSLEMATHIHLGNSNRLARVDQWYRDIGEGYFEAWNLIKKDDLYLQFVKEFGDSTQWQSGSFVRETLADISVVQ